MVKDDFAPIPTVTPWRIFKFLMSVVCFCLSLSFGIELGYHVSSSPGFSSLFQLSGNGLVYSLLLFLFFYVLGLVIIQAK